MSKLKDYYLTNKQLARGIIIIIYTDGKYESEIAEHIRSFNIKNN